MIPHVTVVDVVHLNEAVASAMPVGLEAKQELVELTLELLERSPPEALEAAARRLKGRGEQLVVADEVEVVHVRALEGKLSRTRWLDVCDDLASQSQLTLAKLHDAPLEEEVIEAIEFAGYLDRMQSDRLENVKAEQLTVERGR